MYLWMEEWGMRLRKHAVIAYSMILGLSILVFFCLYMYLPGAPLPRLWREAGSSMGSSAGMIGGLCLAYYLLREFYVRGKKKKVTMAVAVETEIKRGITLLRLFHPLLGVLMTGLVFLHGWLMLFAGPKLTDARLFSGIAATAFLLAVLLVGWKMGPSVSQRRTHRLLAAGLVLGYIVHVAL